MLSFAVVAGALLQGLGSAAPPRAPARGGIKLSSCPQGGSSHASPAHDDSEAGIETFAGDYEITTSYGNGSTCGAQAGENSLDGAFPRRALASADAATKSWLQLYKSSGAGDAFDSETIKGAATAELVANKYQAGGAHALHAIEQTVGSDVQYKNYRSDGTILMLAAPTKDGVDVLDAASAELAPTPGTTMQFVAPDATKGGVDGEAAAQSYLGRTSWCLFQVLASVVPRRSNSAKGAAWRSSVVGYLVIWGDATRVAAETSVRGRSGRGDDNTKSKTKTNNPPRASAGGLAQRRALTGYVMDDDSIRTAVAAWFADQSAAEATYGHISTWETGGVTDLSYLFCGRQDWMEGESWEGLDENCVLSTSSFNEDIGAWDTSGVTRMFGMFWYASSFNQNIGGWSVGNVHEMRHMFNSASSFDQDLGGWRVENVRDMHFMFYDASAFNQDISAWAVDSVTDMSHIFSYASAFDQDLGWCVGDDVSLVEAFSGTPCASTSCGIVRGRSEGGICVTLAPTFFDGAFGDESIRTAVRAWAEDRAAAEATYGHISSWETGGVTDMSFLFCVWEDWMEDKDYCVSEASFNEDIGAWDTSGVTAMNGMFWYASSFNQNIGGWAVHSVKGMVEMFRGASAFDQDIGAWNVENVRDMHWMFHYASSFNQNIGGWSVAQVTNMNNMFSGASAFDQDLGNWRVEQVTDMHGMFNSASSFNQDIGGWRVEQVTNMHGMFNSASAFDQDLGWCVGDDVFDPWGHGNTMEDAFSGTPCESTSCGVVQMDNCPTTGYVMDDDNIKTAVATWFADQSAAEATYGHISSWDTSGVTDMTQLFCAENWPGCAGSAAASFNEDIGAWDTSGVTNMHGMFYEALSFNREIDGWAVGSVTDMFNMFWGASSFNQDIGDWAVHSVTSMGYMFEGASAFDQDLGWCVADSVVDGAYPPFDNTPCESTSCGVMLQGVDCPFPTPRPTMSQRPTDVGDWNKRGGFVNYGLNAGGCFSCSITDDADRLMETCATLCAGDDACKSFEIKPTSGECCIEHVDSSDADYPNYWIDASAIVANCPDHIGHEASLWDTYEPLTAAWRDGADARDTSMCHQFWDYTNDVSELWHYDEHERNGCQGQESASGSLNCAAASTGACLEGGGVDNDCCATCGNGGCAAGYTYAGQVVIDSGTLSSTYPDFYPDCGTMYCGNTCCVPSSGGSDEDEGTGRSWVTITSGDYSWEGQKATCEAVGLSLASYYDLCPDGGDTPRSSALPFFDMSDVWVPYSSDCNGEVSNNWVEMGSSPKIWCGTHHDTNCDGIPTCCGGRPHWGLHPSMNGWQVDKVLCVGGSPEPGNGACDSIHVHYGEACSSAHGEAHGCPIVNVPRETWDYDLWSCDDLCGRVGGWCERAAYMSNDHCGSDVHEEYELSCDQGIRDSGLTYPSHTLCWCRVDDTDHWWDYYHEEDDDDDDDGGSELVMSGGLVAIGLTFTGITIAAIANAVQEQCALGPTIVYEAGTTHPYYISPNLCTIGTKTFSSDKTVRDASPRKVCRKFCEAASEKGKLALKHVQGLTCYCKRR